MSHECKGINLEERAFRTLVANTMKHGAPLDENQGDWTETYESVLFWATDGDAGKCWGLCHFAGETYPCEEGE